MTKDIGIVFLPNQSCKEFAAGMTRSAARLLPEFKEAVNNLHITAIHIANLNEVGQANIQQVFREFYHKFAATCISLPYKDISATGGSMLSGYKWLDLQFETLPVLANIRQAALDTFCPLHNGVLTRMYDDMVNFTPQQQGQIKTCGVTFANYLPHITAWYIDLPSEPKTNKLQDIAFALKVEVNELTCFAESIALVELGRNGNAIRIIEQHPLCVSLSGSDTMADEL
jgi:hypothetical protein